MSRSIARARAGRDRTSLYQEITDKIITELEAGRVPWGTVAAKAPLTVFNTDQCEDLVRQVRIARILSSESTTYRLDQAILFIASDALGHDALQKAILRTRQIDHWLASDFDGTIMFGEADAVQHAACENSECRAHENLNTIPQAASIGDKTAA
jgi:hypothetical protein